MQRRAKKAARKTLRNSRRSKRATRKSAVKRKAIKRAVRKKAIKKAVRRIAIRRVVRKNVVRRVVTKRQARKKIAAKKKIADSYPVEVPMVAETSKFVKRKRKTDVQDLSKISVRRAEFLHDNVLAITFNDGTQRQVDFAPFFTDNIPDYLQKYKSPHQFKSFKIESGNLVWGEHWDLIFPLPQLYAGKILL